MYCTEWNENIFFFQQEFINVIFFSDGSKVKDEKYIQFK